VRRNHLAVRQLDQPVGAPAVALAWRGVGEHQQRLTLLLPTGSRGPGSGKIAEGAGLQYPPLLSTSC